jgi:hypothetical protein
MVEPVSAQPGAHRRFVSPAAVGLDRRSISARKRAMVSGPTATPTVASNSRMRRSEPPFCRSSTMPSLNGASLA